MREVFIWNQFRCKMRIKKTKGNVYVKIFDITINLENYNSAIKNFPHSEYESDVLKNKSLKMLQCLAFRWNEN